MSNWVAGGFENLDNCIRLISSSLSSTSSKNEIDNIGSKACLVSGQADIGPVGKSSQELVNSSNVRTSLSRSQSCLSLHSSSTYDSVHNKVKQCVDIFNPNQGISKIPPREASKEEYLQEINSRLMREVEEKNAALQQLQENYEHLLLKYAEAQNKIDNLRFQSSSNKDELSHLSGGRKKKKCYIKKLPKPVVYKYKSSQNEGKEQCHKEFASKQLDAKVDRPSTLPVDPNSLTYDKNVMKAVTPTDSEGMSSVVTSMSGHSKILTNLDGKEDEKKQPLKTQVLQTTLPVFDKVTHWQNSLPPLEMIEKPDSIYFDGAESPSTLYNELPLSDLENIAENSEWSAPQNLIMSQMGMKKYLRTLSLPTSLTRRNMLAQIYKKKSSHTIDLSWPAGAESQNPSFKPEAQHPTQDPTEANVMFRRKARAPFLRSASLPVYECDSPRPAIPCPVSPLNLENLALTEDESSPDTSKNNQTTPLVTSHDCSFQTLDSLNSCNASSTQSQWHRQDCIALHKSTSITPDRTKMFFNEGSREFGLDCCNVCGEIVQSAKAASYHGNHGAYDTKQPICRSHSFNSDMVSPSQTLVSGVDKEAIEAFDLFTSNLKARSQITMKALTAHVNKS